MAAWQRQPEVVRSLLAHKANPSPKEDTGRTPLHMAATKEIVVLLLDHGADVHALDNEGESALFNLAIARDPSILELLLAKGADPNTRLRESGWTPLHQWINHSLMDSRARCTELLLHAGAKAEVADDDGVTPLHLAVKERSTRVVSLLLEHGANPMAPTRRDVPYNHFEYPAGTTPIGAAKGEPKIVALLRAAGASVAPPMEFRIVRRKDGEGEWRVVVPLESTQKAGLAKALKSLTAVMTDVDRCVFHHPDYGSRDRFMTFELEPSKGKTWSEEKFFTACCKEKELHAPVAAFVEAVITANGEDGADTVYASEELEEGTHAIRALLLARATRALPLYLKFLKSIDLDHTVAQPAVVAAISKLYTPKQLRPVRDQLGE